MEAPSIRRLAQGGTSVALALCPLLLLACASSHPNANPPAIPAARFEQQLNDSCGQPIIYPISAQCVAMMGSVGPLLQHRSDLLLAIWRSCPDQNPCSRVAATQPACTGQSSGGPPVVVSAEACKKAQQADYSCAALLNDPVYSGYLHQAGVPQDPYECQRSKEALDDFDREVERMSLRIQWYRIFAKQGY